MIFNKGSNGKIGSRHLRSAQLWPEFGELYSKTLAIGRALAALREYAVYARPLALHHESDRAGQVGRTGLQAPPERPDEIAVGLRKGFGGRWFLAYQLRIKHIESKQYNIIMSSVIY